MKRSIDKFDREAEAEAKAITSHNKFRPHVSRLNKTYTCDGYRFNTGKKHRSAGHWSW